jgi:hypothetical protein
MEVVVVLPVSPALLLLPGQKRLGALIRRPHVVFPPVEIGITILGGRVRPARTESQLLVATDGSLVVKLFGRATNLNYI